MRYPVVIKVTIVAEYTNYEERTYTYLDYVEGLTGAAESIKAEFGEKEVVSCEIKYMGGNGDHFFVNDELIEKIREITEHSY